jgi:hypothetical protein
MAFQSELRWLTLQAEAKWIGYTFLTMKREAIDELNLEIRL